MKIVLIIIVLLLAVSSIYLYSAQSSSLGVVATVSVPSTPAVNTNQCTSTACMKKTADIKPADAVVLTQSPGTPAQATPVASSIAQKVTEVIKKVVPGKPVTLNAVDSYPAYIDFVNPSGFVNSEPFKLADYIGKKVILVEFITYTCINCQRTFPYLKQWYETYQKDGLLVVGIHTPEFAFEKDRANVVGAMKKEGISFPVVQDNDFQTWNAYGNRFWPHRYVIDYDGKVVFDHAGEGAYTETEAVIKLLLANKPAGV